VFFGEPFGGLLPGARGAVLAVLLRTDAPLTGRQIHAMVSDDYSLWSVQKALQALAQIGVVQMHTVGRAGIHTINEHHAAVAHLRDLVDPLAALTSIIKDAVDSCVQAVVLFGSIARGETRPDSDIDLAVIAAPDWAGRVALEDVVKTRLGNDCDVVVFTESDFETLAIEGEPVVHEILRDGIALAGTKPPARPGAT